MFGDKFLESLRMRFCPLLPRFGSQNIGPGLFDGCLSGDLLGCWLWLCWLWLWLIAARAAATAASEAAERAS